MQQESTRLSSRTMSPCRVWFNHRTPSSMATTRGASILRCFATHTRGCSRCFSIHNWLNPWDWSQLSRTGNMSPICRSSINRRDRTTQETVASRLGIYSIATAHIRLSNRIQCNKLTSWIRQQLIFTLDQSQDSRQWGTSPQLRTIM